MVGQKVARRQANGYWAGKVRMRRDGGGWSSERKGNTQADVDTRRRSPQYRPHPLSQFTLFLYASIFGVWSLEIV